MSPSQRPKATLNWVFENQPIVSGKLTQPSNRKKFVGDEKGL